MTRSQGVPIRQLLGLAVCILFPAAAAAQDFLMRVEPAKKSVAVNVISLRPNAPTTVSFLLRKNPDAVETDMVNAELVQMIGDQMRVLARATAKAKPDEDEMRFEFAKAAKDAPDKLDLGEAPFHLFLRVPKARPAKDEDPYLKKELKLRIREPRDFVDVTAADFDKDAQALKFKVLLRDVAVGPRKCVVNLVLGPEFRTPKKGNFKVELTDVNKELELFAEGLDSFRSPDDLEGHVYLSVDGYEHAFIFTTTLKESGKLPEVTYDNKVGADLRVPRYAVPSEKIPIAMLLDGPLDAGYRVELALDRTGRKEQFPQKKAFAGLRRQKMELSFSPKGDLVWKSDIGALKTEMDISDVFGPVWLRLRVLKDEREVELVPTTPALPGSAILVRDPEDKESKALYAKVTLDATPPLGLEFVDLPRDREWPLHKPLTLQVKIAKREEYQAPIDGVLFIKGKVPEGGKINPDAVLGPAVFDAKKRLWFFIVDAQEKSEPLDITVQATTRAGLVAVKSTTISFRDAGPGKTLVNIKGKIFHGDIAQPKLAVTLADVKGNVKGAEKTNDKGEFVFPKVAPGVYVVSAMTTFPALVGRTKVEVKEGDVKDVDGTVKLLAK